MIGKDANGYRVSLGLISKALEIFCEKCFISFAAAAMVLLGAVPDARALKVTDDNQPVCEMMDSPLEPFPVTELSGSGELFLPDRDQLALIGRLAKGIHEWKTRREHGWWECGEFYETGPDTEDKAILLAYRLVQAVSAYTQVDGGNRQATLSMIVWGMAGTIANESSFDRCAVGYYFRKWAIKKKMLKPRTRSISYGEEELLVALHDLRAASWLKETGVDVGYCQLLTRFYNGSVRDMMDPEKGIEICAHHFHLRAKMLGTTRPWRYWRGYNAAGYESRVEQRARALGASRDEI